MDETLWASRWVHRCLPYAYHSAAKKWRDCPQHEQVPDDMRAVNAIVEQEHARAERIPHAAGDEQDQERARHASNQGRGRHLHHHPTHRQIECLELEFILAAFGYAGTTLAI